MPTPRDFPYIWATWLPRRITNGNYYGTYPDATLYFNPVS